MIPVVASNSPVYGLCWAHFNHCSFLSYESELLPTGFEKESLNPLILKHSLVVERREGEVMVIRGRKERLRTCGPWLLSLRGTIERHPTVWKLFL